MKIAVLLSGGVDSSVALYKLIEKGYKKIKCYYLKIWLEDELSYLGSCPWEEDLSYVKTVCNKLEVPYEVINLQQEYYQNIVTYVIKELKNGNTPSPDIFCNSLIKFGIFLDKINKEYELIVTGHYAKIKKKHDHYVIQQAKDKIKDQSYFLAYLNQKQISRLYFPLGNLTKNEVRMIANKINLPNKNRKDSQGICFLGKFKYSNFIKYHLGTEKGQIIEKETNKVLGKHNGFWLYTIGQRKGLELGEGPWFVIDKDIKNNIIYISHERNLINHNKIKLLVHEVNWIYKAPSKNEDLDIKLRHGERKVPCLINYIKNDLIEITLKQGEKGISPGQFAIFYSKNICLGGAKIYKSLNSI